AGRRHYQVPRQRWARDSVQGGLERLDGPQRPERIADDVSDTKSGCRDNRHLRRFVLADRGPRVRGRLHEPHRRARRACELVATSRANEWRARLWSSLDCRGCVFGRVPKNVVFKRCFRIGDGAICLVDICLVVPASGAQFNQISDWHRVLSELWDLHWIASPGSGWRVEAITQREKWHYCGLRRRGAIKQGETRQTCDAGIECGRAIQQRCRAARGDLPDKAAPLETRREPLNGLFGQTVRPKGRYGNSAGERGGMDRRCPVPARV